MVMVRVRERELVDVAELILTTTTHDDGDKEFMVSPTPHSRSSSPVEVILLDTSSSDDEQSESRNLTNQTINSRPGSRSSSHSDSDDWSYQDDIQPDWSEHEEEHPSFFSMLSRALSSGSLSWQTLESIYGSGLQGSSTRTWAPMEGRRRLRSDYRLDNPAEFVPVHQQIDQAPESPVGIEREETRKGFARSFELDIGGFIDSSSDRDEDEDEEEDKRVKKKERTQTIQIDQDDDEEVEEANTSSSITSKVHPLPSVPNSTDRPPLTGRISSDDSIHIVEPDGIEHSLPSDAVSSSFQPSSSSSSLATMAIGTTATIDSERTSHSQRARKQKRRPPRIQQYGLSFGCSSCLRPLLQRASGPDRKIYVLSCGHLVDGYCLVRLCARPDSTFPFVYPSSITESSEDSSRDKKKLKSKIKPPRLPIKSRSYEWFCPVEGCERPHQSILDVFIDKQSGEVGMFLEGPQWCWRPVMGGVEGVRLLFV